MCTTAGATARNAYGAECLLTDDELKIVSFRNGAVSCLTKNSRR